jgi:hypothetical protein
MAKKGIRIQLKKKAAKKARKTIDKFPTENENSK